MQFSNQEVSFQIWHCQYLKKYSTFKISKEKLFITKKSREVGLFICKKGKEYQRSKFQKRYGGINHLIPIQKLLKLELETKDLLANSQSQANESSTSTKSLLVIRC